jgi:hypothetical protein
MRRRSLLTHFGLPLCVIFYVIWNTQSRKMRSMDVDLVNVFTQKGSGGKPCPVVCRADGMLDADMQSVACEYGHEIGFALLNGSGDFNYRLHNFRSGSLTCRFIPNHVAG